MQSVVVGALIIAYLIYLGYTQNKNTHETNP